MTEDRIKDVADCYNIKNIQSCCANAKDGKSGAYTKCEILHPDCVHDA
jgi:hypothetical protein